MTLHFFWVATTCETTCETTQMQRNNSTSWNRVHDSFRKEFSCFHQPDCYPVIPQCGHSKVTELCLKVWGEGTGHFFTQQQLFVKRYHVQSSHVHRAYYGFRFWTSVGTPFWSHSAEVDEPWQVWFGFPAVSSGNWSCRRCTQNPPPWSRNCVCALKTFTNAQG